MIDIDIKKVEEIIRHVAEVEVMPRFKNLQEGDISEKNGPTDLVTVADLASEKLFTKLLSEYLPDSLVVGEEAVFKDISVLDKLKENNPVWVIDPIDGTYNFSHGTENFGILLALVQGGITQYGWAFDALGNRMLSAKKGHGVFLNGEEIKLRNDKRDISEIILQGGGGQAEAFKDISRFFKEVINIRCSLHDFMNMLTGKADALLHINKVTPWDHAACCLMVEEAGGFIGLIDGENREAYNPTELKPAFLLAAQSEELWYKMHDKVFGKLKDRAA